jgi:glucose-6-phosphate isomerase
MNAAIHYLGYERGRTLSVMMPYSQALEGVAEWFCQLWAESLGKKHDLEGRVVHVGPTPIKALGVTDQHSQVQLYAEGRFDKIVNFVAVERFRNEVAIPEDVPATEGVGYLGGHTLNELMRVEREGTAIALAEAGRPNVTFTLPEVNPFTVGQLLFTLEVQTAMMGELFRINAFDQPGVEAGKAAAFALMGRPGYEGRRQEIQASRRPSPKYVI